MSMKSKKNIIIQAHRGSHSNETPENSIESCLKAIDLGVDMIEIDVHVSKDHHIVVTHDSKILGRKNTHSDGKSITQKEENNLKIYSLNYQEISKFPFRTKQKGIRYNYIPLLLDLVVKMDQYAQDKKLKLPKLNIELKSDRRAVKYLYPKSSEYAKILKKTIRKFPNNFPYIVQSFDLKLIKKVSKFIDKRNLCFLVNDPKKEKLMLSQCRILGIKNVGINYKNLRIKKAKKLIKKDFIISIWTINNFSKIPKFIDAGVVNFITDKPEELIEFLKHNKLREE